MSGTVLIAAFGLAMGLCGLLMAQSNELRQDPFMSPLPSERSKEAKVQVNAGTDIRLRCSIQSNDTAYISPDDVTWYFKPCGNVPQKPLCDASNEDDWQLLDCGSTSCKPTLDINKTDPDRDSGLYRCTISPYRLNDRVSLQISLQITYELIVTGSTVTLPELLNDLPTNQTALVGTNVVFQCRVRSRVLPSIRWFRRYDKGDPKAPPPNRTITYNDHIYERLPSAGEKELVEDVYLSKLILTGVQLRDDGFYACVGVNHMGLKMGVAYLRVETPETMRSRGGQFLMLFLIPAGFVLIPTVLWMVCLAIRRRTGVEVAEEKQVVVEPPMPTYRRRRRRRRFQKKSEPNLPYAIVNVDIV